MAWTLCTSESAICKAGADANSTITASGVRLLTWSNEAEGFVCGLVRSDVVTNWTSLTANGKNMLSELSSSLIAQKIVGYDLRSYGTRATAQTILDILENNIRRIIRFFEEKSKFKEYLGII